MRKSHWPIAAVALCFATLLAAQTPAKPDPAAEAAAAMERAKRQAAGPMRIILEASKARRKPGEVEAAAVAAPTTAPEATSLRPVASRSATPGAVVTPTAGSTPPNVVAGPVIAPAALAANPAVSAVPAVTGGPSPGAVDAQATLDPGALGAKATPAAVSGLESSSVVGPIVAPLAVAPKVTVPQLQTSDRVRLLSMVEPEVPQRVLDEMGRNAAIQVDLLLRADGTVASVELASPAPRGMLRMLTPSLEQWKFAPLAAQRTHRIELLFNVER